MTADFPRRQQRREGFEESELERRGTRLEMNAPVTGAVSLGDCIAVGFGDGSVRFFRPGLAHTVTRAHEGVVLCCLLYTSPSPRDVEESRMPSSA